MQDKEYIIKSADSELGISFEYQVHGQTFGHTIFLDNYTAPAVKAAIEEYVLAEDTRLADNTKAMPDSVASLVGEVLSAEGV